MPIFACRTTVALDVTDNFRINLAGSVKSERSLYDLVLQVTINRLRTAYHLNARILGLIIFSQHGSIGVRVVTSHDDQRFDIQFAHDFQSFFKLFFLLKLGSACSDDVKPACIAIFIYHLCRQLLIFMIDQSARSQNEAKQTAILIILLQTIKQTGNHIMSARGRTTGQQDAHINCRIIFLLLRFHKT